MRQAGRQAVLANQHFIFPVDTCTDVTVHVLTLAGDPTTLERAMAREAHLILPWDSKREPHANKTELLLTNSVLVHVLWDPSSASILKGWDEVGQRCSGGSTGYSDLSAQLLA